MDEAAIQSINPSTALSTIEVSIALLLLAVAVANLTILPTIAKEPPGRLVVFAALSTVAVTALLVVVSAHPIWLFKAFSAYVIAFLGIGFLFSATSPNRFALRKKTFIGGACLGLMLLLTLWATWLPS